MNKFNLGDLVQIKKLKDYRYLQIGQNFSFEKYDLEKDFFIVIEKKDINHYIIKNTETNESLNIDYFHLKHLRI